MQRFRMLVRYAKQEGSRALLAVIADVFRVNVLGTRAFVHLSCKLTDSKQAGDADVVVREITTADRERIERIWYTPRREVDRRFAIGERCFVALVDGRLVHWSWVSLREADMSSEIGRRESLPPHEGYVYNCRTARAARGRGVFTTALRVICDVLAREGFTTLKAIVDETNAASLNAFRAAGFDAVALEKRGGIVARSHTKSIDWSHLAYRC